MTYILLLLNPVDADSYLRGSANDTGCCAQSTTPRTRSSIPLKQSKPLQVHFNREALNDLVDLSLRCLAVATIDEARVG
jgi:hypothetical protein